MGCEAGQDAPRRIVVGVNGSPASMAAIRWAAREAALRGVVLHAVHAWEHPLFGRAPYAPGAPAGDRAAAASLLTTAVRAALGEDSTADPLLEVAEGLAARVLLRCAAGAELLVLGGKSAAESHSAYQFTPHVGAVARCCLYAAPCPVVVVTQQQALAAGSQAPAAGSQAHEGEPGQQRKLAGAALRLEPGRTSLPGLDELVLGPAP